MRVKKLELDNKKRYAILTIWQSKKPDLSAKNAGRVLENGWGDAITAEHGTV